jgi:DNA (cytosine-5)-methyltransferase 1
MGCKNRRVATRPTVLSAFSGLGGLDLGLEAAGFDAVGCIEIDATARRSLKVNRGSDWPILEPGDITAFVSDEGAAALGVEQGKLSLLAGAPPCQPYSKAAMWSPGAWNGLADERATPVFAFLDLVDRLLPAALLLENVPGFARGDRSALRVFERALLRVNAKHGTGYRLQVMFVDALDYGVPQRRQRAILVAFRDGSLLSQPTPTHRHKPVRAWDALRTIDDPSPAPPMTGSWADLLPSIPEGSNYLWHTNRGGGRHLFGYRTRYWSFLLKLAKAEPSWTIPAQPGPSAGPFHWESRPLRVMEMLRLQTFPIDWIVEGARREQVKQVGNATPPLLAEVLGRAVANHLGYATPVRPLRFRIPRAQLVPPPEPLAPVPRKYRELEGDHDAHPGAGLGPNPRST